MIDHNDSDLVLALSFKTLSKIGGSHFIEPRSLSKYVSEIIKKHHGSSIFIPNDKFSWFASASIDMWERAIHSFLCSVALTEESPIWSSAMGYYSSHYTMRAFAHSFGFFKSFADRKIAQITIVRGRPLFSIIDEREKGEHVFYWKVVKEYPLFIQHPLFRLNAERDTTSESTHRNHANYSDHLNRFHKFNLPKDQEFEQRISSITSKNLSDTEIKIKRDRFPSDLINVQILAYQRIVIFRDFLEERISNNQFWRARKSPSWYKLDFNLGDDSKTRTSEYLIK